VTATDTIARVSGRYDSLADFGSCTTDADVFLNPACSFIRLKPGTGVSYDYYGIPSGTPSLYCTRISFFVPFSKLRVDWQDFPVMNVPRLLADRMHHPFGAENYPAEYYSFGINSHPGWGTFSSEDSSCRGDDENPNRDISGAGAMVLIAKETEDFNLAFSPLWDCHRSESSSVHLSHTPSEAWDQLQFDEDPVDRLSRRHQKALRIAQYLERYYNDRTIQWESTREGHASLNRRIMGLERRNRKTLKIAQHLQRFYNEGIIQCDQGRRENQHLNNRIVSLDRRNGKVMKITQSRERYYNDRNSQCDKDHHGVVTRYSQQSAELAALRKASAVLQDQSLKNKRVEVELRRRVLSLQQTARSAEEQVQSDLADRGILQRRLSGADSRCNRMKHREVELEKELVEQKGANMGLREANERMSVRLPDVVRQLQLFIDENETLKNECAQLRNSRDKFEKVQQERAQLQEEFARLQEEKDAERTELIRKIDDLRRGMESNTMKHPSGRRHRRSQPRFAGSQTMIAQEERYMSVLSLASDRITEGHAPNLSLEHLAR
jgi:hypothetical protein